MRSTELSGWGRYPRCECRLANLRHEDQFPGQYGTGSLIARGNGRSYGDAALNPELTLSMLAMDRLLSFDEESGVLDCEAGVLLADLLSTFVPRGWFPPVVPGTAQVTVGGMIAADVHGKNHHRDGSFGNHVESFRLATGDGEVLNCSRDENAELFRATIGGMGLTGVLLSASFRMVRIESEVLRTETLATRDLDATMDTLAASDHSHYSVAWIDGSARGGALGRGLVSRGDFAAPDAIPARTLSRSRSAAQRQMPVPALPLSLTLNAWSVRSFNSLYYRLGATRRRAMAGALESGSRFVHYRSFFFPLDRILDWNRLYGRRGFVQHQCVLPTSQGPQGVRAILEHLEASGHIAYLAVLKLLGPQGEGLLSFPMAGHTLALDLPMRPGTLDLLDSLDEITAAHGGRIYLAKDAHCQPDQVRAGYPNLGLFSDVRSARDATSRFSSLLSRRLEL